MPINTKKTDYQTQVHVLKLHLIYRTLNVHSQIALSYSLNTQTYE